MTTTKTVKEDQKEKLLNQLKNIQAKISILENQRAEKIMKLAKKFNLLNLPDKTIEHEFALIKSKYEAQPENTLVLDDVKKN